MKRILIAVFCIGLISIAFYSYSRFNVSLDKPNGNQRPAVAQIVNVAPVMRKDVPVQISTVGHVQRIAFVAVRPRIDGVISKVAVEDGQRVKAGDMLFLLDDREEQAALRIAKANLQRDQAQLENARKELARIRPLLEKNYATKQQMDQLSANVAMQEAIVAADVVEIEQRELTLSYTTIRAPIDGRLGTIQYKTGNVVRASDPEPLLVINQMQPIYVDFSVTQQDITALQNALEGDPPKVYVSLPGSSLPVQTGEVAYIENTVDSATNTLAVKATFANVEEHLWPGQFVNVTATLHLQKGALTIPLVALQNGQNGMFVWVVKEGMAEMRTVQVERTTADEAIIAEGLVSGEQVVTEGHLRLQQGTKVEIRTSAISTSSQLYSSP